MPMYRIRTEFSGMQGAPWLSTMFFQEGGGTAQQAVTAVGVFWGAVDARIDTEVNWTTLADVETVEQTTGDVTAVTSTTPATGTGGEATSSLPPATQGLVRWRTGQYIAGREVRGRTFIPGLVIGTDDNGQVISTYMTTVNNAAAALIADANSALTIWSRANNLERVVTSGTMWAQYAVLRSRRD